MRSASDRSFTVGLPQVCKSRVGIANVSTGLSGSKEILKNLTRSAVWMLFVKGCGASNHLLQHCLDPKQWTCPANESIDDSEVILHSGQHASATRQRGRQLLGRRLLCNRLLGSCQYDGRQLPERRLLRNRLLGSCPDEDFLAS